MLLIMCFAAAVLLARPTLVLITSALATGIALYYIWQSERVRRAVLEISGGGPFTRRRQRRLLARGLRYSVRMTAHQSLFPKASLRGYAMANALRTRR